MVGSGEMCIQQHMKYAAAYIHMYIWVIRDAQDSQCLTSDSGMDIGLSSPDSMGKTRAAAQQLPDNARLHSAL